MDEIVAALDALEAEDLAATTDAALQADLIEMARQGHRYDAQFTRIITRGRSQPLDVGRVTRTVTFAQRLALIVRDGGCGWQGCDRPPRFCDVHHRVPWALGGETNLDDLILLCRRHHRMVHEERAPGMCLTERDRRQAAGIIRRGAGLLTSLGSDVESRAPP